MSLRTLAVDIAFDAELGKIMAVDSAVDDIKDSAIDAGSSVDDLAGVSDTASGSILDSFTKVGDNMQDIGKKMSLGITTPLVGIGTAAIHTVSKFDDSMSAVQAISGATADEFVELRQLAMDLGATTAFSASEAADAMTNLATAGWDTNQILSATPDMLSLASAGGLDLAQAASITTNTMSQFSMEADRAGETADMFAVAASSANTNVAEIGEAMKYAGGSAVTMNMDLAQTNAVLATFASQGLVGSSAGTAFTAMFSDLSTKAKDGAVSIGESSVAVYDASGAMRDMGSIMADVEKATDGMNDAQKNAALQNIFGIQAMNGVNIMLSEGSEAYQELEAAIYDSEGAAAEMADVMEDNLAGAFRGMGSALEGFMIQVGDQLKPFVQDAAEFIGNMAAKFGELDDSTKKTIVVFGGILAAIGPALLIFGKILSTIDPVVTLFGKLSGAVTKAGGVMALLSNPITIAVAAIGLIIGAVVLAYNKVEWFRDMLDAAWDWIKTSTSIAFEWIRNIITVVMGSIMEFVGSVLASLTAFWSAHGEFIMSLIQEKFNSIMGTIQMVMGIIQGIFEIVWPIISGIVQVTWGIIQGVVQSAIDIVLGIISAAMSLLQGDWQGAWDAIFGIVTNIWDNILGFFAGVDLYQIGVDILQGLINGISSMAEAVWTKIGEIAEGIKSKFSWVLEIFSPSRAFKRFGIDTMMGYTIGFEDEAANAIDSAEDAAIDISDVFDDEDPPEPDFPNFPVGDPSPGGNNSGGGGATMPVMNFEFHFAKGDKSEIKEAAAMTKREFKKMWQELQQELEVRTV